MYVKGSHEPFRASKPIYTSCRVPQATERIHTRNAYTEPQQGPHGPTLATYTERRQTPQQRVHVQVTTVTTRRMHIEPLRIVANTDIASRHVDRNPVHSRLRYTPYPQTTTAPLNPTRIPSPETPNLATQAIEALAEAPDAEETSFFPSVY